MTLNCMAIDETRFANPIDETCFAMQLTKNCSVMLNGQKCLVLPSITYDELLGPVRG